MKLCFSCCHLFLCKFNNWLSYNTKWDKNLVHFMKSYGPRVEFAAKRKNRFVKKMRIIREKIRDLKKSKIFAKNHQNKHTASTPMVFAKYLLEISRKSLRNTNENFRIFSRNFSFAANPCQEFVLSYSNNLKTLKKDDF